MPPSGDQRDEHRKPKHLSLWRKVELVLVAVTAATEVIPATTGHHEGEAVGTKDPSVLVAPSPLDDAMKASLNHRAAGYAVAPVEWIDTSVLLTRDEVQMLQERSPDLASALLQYQPSVLVDGSPDQAYLVLHEPIHPELMVHFSFDNAEDARALQGRLAEVAFNTKLSSPTAYWGTPGDLTEFIVVGEPGPTPQPIHVGEAAPAASPFNLSGAAGVFSTFSIPVVIVAALYLCRTKKQSTVSFTDPSGVTMTMNQVEVGLDPSAIQTLKALKDLLPSFPSPSESSPTVQGFPGLIS
jgi:hypothetical protein